MELSGRVPWPAPVSNRRTRASGDRRHTWGAKCRDSVTGCSRMSRRVRSTSGACPSATTSPPTSATSTRATSRRWSGSASTATSARGRLGRAAGPRQPGRATCCARTGSSAATGSRWCSRRRPRRRRSSSAPGSSGRSCSRCRCSTATRASATGSRTRSRRCWSPTRQTPGASMPALVDDGARARRRDCSTGAPDRPRSRGHLRRRPGAALLHVGNDRPGEGHRPRPPLHPRPRGVRLLPRRPRRRALPRHGRVGLGGRHRAAARAVAPRRRPVRATSARAASTRRAARLPLAPRGHERLHDADRDALDDGDRRRRRRATRRSSASSAPRASRSTPRRSAGFATSTASPCSTTTG